MVLSNIAIPKLSFVLHIWASEHQFLNLLLLYLCNKYNITPLCTDFVRIKALDTVMGSGESEQLIKLYLL